MNGHIQNYTMWELLEELDRTSEPQSSSPLTVERDGMYGNLNKRAAIPCVNEYEEDLV